MKHFLYLLYQLLVAGPILLLLTILTALFTIIGCTVGQAHIWSYIPAMLWSRAFCYLLLLPVKIKGRELLDPKQSYVFVANHQGSFDIFLIFGFLGRNFKWMMKRELRQVPMVGKACEEAGHIFVDKRGPKAIKKTYDQARRVLQGGTSLFVFPEGSRTFTGHMGLFRKGAFQLAKEIGLSVVPITINGSFQVLPRTRGFNFAHWHPLTLTIHAPINTQDREEKDIRETAYDNIMNALPPELQGYEENKDQ